MRGFLRGYGIKFAIAAVLAVVMCLNRASAFGDAISDVNALLVTAFGGAVPMGSISFYASLIAMLPLVTHLTFFVDYLSSDMSTVAVYVFSRTKRRGRWLFKRMAGLCALSAAYYAVCFASGAAAGLAMGLEVPALESFLATLALLFATAAAWGTLFVMAAALLAIKCKSSLVLSAGISAWAAWIFAFPLIPAPAAGWAVPIVPMSHALLAAHDAEAAAFLDSVLGEKAFNISLSQSMAYLAVCSLIFALASWRWVATADFIELQ